MMLPVPPRSPLPPRDGLDAAWVRTPDARADRAPAWSTMREFLTDRLPAGVDVDARLAAGVFVDASGRPWTGDEAYRPHTFIWFHRPRPVEVEVPFPLVVLHADERLVVVDKPPFLATTPRGGHVLQTVLVRARRDLGLPELTPAHRLDRLTSGVLVLTTSRRWRGPYQSLFATGHVAKTYEAIAAHDPELDLPLVVRDHLVKRRGHLQVEVVPDAPPNAETLVELDAVRGDWARYRLTPRTGRTHQLRVHLAGLGLPIVGDSLYPTARSVAPDDFSEPLRLVARRLAFHDPVDGAPRTFTSRAVLAWPAGADGRMAACPPP